MQDALNGLGSPFYDARLRPVERTSKSVHRGSLADVLLVVRSPQRLVRHEIVCWVSEAGGGPYEWGELPSSLVALKPHNGRAWKLAPLNWCDPLRNCVLH